MSKKYVLTANDLTAGDVVYFAKSGPWARSLKDAYLFEDEAQAQNVLEQAHNDNTLIGVYLFEVKIENGEIIPSHFREAFRAKGPSNYHHGKQEALNVSL